MLQEALNRATKAFPDRLQAIGLITRLPESGTITGLSVKLVGHDGNAFAILGAVQRVLCGGGHSQEVYRRLSPRGHSGRLRPPVADRYEIRRSGIIFLLYS